MTSQADLDLLLTAWLSEGSERVPERYVSAALDRVAATRQRRSTRWALERQWRLATFALAALLVAIVAVGITVGIGLIRVPVPSPSPLPVTSPEATQRPTATPTPVPTPTASARERATFIAPDGSFEITTSALTPDEGPDPSALYFTDAGTALSIRSGEVGGGVLSCDDGRPSFEQCGSITGLTLEELAEGIDVPRNADPPAMWQGPNESEMTLDGEPALLISMIGSDFTGGGMRPVSLAYIVAIHDGQSIIIRAFRPDGTGLAGLPRLLEGFRFR
jgi:hypothetical protein